jgi:hypothetical protein
VSSDRHLCAAAAVDDGHFTGAPAHGGPRGIHGGEATADYQRATQRLVPKPRVALFEEVDSRKDALPFSGPGYSAGGATLGANCQIGRVIAVGLQIS